MTSVFILFIPIDFRPAIRPTRSKVSANQVGSGHRWWTSNGGDYDGGDKEEDAGDETGEGDSL